MKIDYHFVIKDSAKKNYCTLLNEAQQGNNPILNVEKGEGEKGINTNVSPSSVLKN